MNPEKLKQLQEQVRIGGKVNKHLCFIYLAQYGSFWYPTEHIKSYLTATWSGLILLKKICFRGLPEGRRRLSTEQLQQMTKNYRVPSKNCQWTIFLALKRLVLWLKFWWYLEWLNRSIFFFQLRFESIIMFCSLALF